MSKQIHSLDINVHPQLEKSLGYQSNRRWVAWYWEPDIEQAFFTDGQNVGTTSSLSWQIFLEHPKISSSLQQYFSPNDQQYGLLLDRTTRNLYVGEGKLIQNLLEQPDSLSVLACLETPDRSFSLGSNSLKYQWNQFTHFALLLNLLKWVPLGVGIAVITTLGLKNVSSLIPKLEQQLKVSPPAQPLLISNQSCGVGGSDDLTRYVTTTSQSKELHLIGVYEAHPNHSGNDHSSGTISVEINRQNQPIILALSAYEPVTWEVNVKPGVILEKIILNGYYDQKIIGVSGIPIEEYSQEGTNRVLGNFPYQWNSVSSTLVNQLEKQIELPVTSFQGCYRGTAFKIQ
ncbi:conserved hypothetical protein [Planktothrix serta PCC 8927]|uniref:Uncharacterized protein n=1 Tax=Planktothrix serta PCC 8927 TaxID=671068 RepID=A0A7Z9DZV9_9CYAN|nr:hypothetical protein [Planktothrix serta]VXD18263.1 conserved hypothetical protein [Planktothrix serta PCC 8927]